MHSKKEFRIFVRCAVAQLLNGSENLARGPINSARRLTIDPFATVLDHGDDLETNLFGILLNMGSMINAR